MSETLSALTVLQPWASLIRIGAKRFETRGWETKHRGPLAIHAGAKRANVEDITPEIFKALVDGGVIPASCPLKNVPDLLPVGVLLCLADLLDCHKTERMTFPGELQITPEYHFGNFEPGRFGWELEVTQVFNPAIPAKGFQRLWKWTCPVSLLNPQKGAIAMAKKKESTKNKPEDAAAALPTEGFKDETQILSEKDIIGKAFAAPVERPGVATDPAFDNSEDAGDVEDPIVPRMPQVKTFADAVDPSEDRKSVV